MTEYHLCGSCAMGDVVNERLKVKGLRGLRVVDASVCPGHVSGNILSTAYAVAERAADLIKEDAAATGGSQHATNGCVCKIQDCFGLPLCADLVM